jgi:acetoacetyl-CoA synthetase
LSLPTASSWTTLKGRINGAIRRPLVRHVPDDIVAVRAVPRTLTGKKMEVPVKRLLQGRPLAEVAAPGAPPTEGLDWSPSTPGA